MGMRFDSDAIGQEQSSLEDRVAALERRTVFLGELIATECRQRREAIQPGLTVTVYGAIVIGAAVAVVVALLLRLLT